MFQRPFREHNVLVRFQSQDSWSQIYYGGEQWCLYKYSGYTENPGSGQPGYMWSNIRNVLDEEDGFCGIYEFQVRGTLLGQLQSAVTVQ